jgi:hypothetical protein
MTISQDSIWNTLYDNNSSDNHPSQTHYILYDLKNYNSGVIHRFPQWSCFFHTKYDADRLLELPELDYILSKLTYIFVPHRNMKHTLSNLYPKLIIHLVVLYQPIQFEPFEGYETFFTNISTDDDLTFMKHSLDGIDYMENESDESHLHIIYKCLKHNTPLLLKRKPEYEEYLGTNYPLFFEYPDTNYISRIPKAKHHLKMKDKTPFSLENCSIVFKNRINRIMNQGVDKAAKTVTWIVPCIDSDSVKLRQFISDTFMGQKKKDVNDRYHLHIVNVPKSHTNPDVIQSILNQYKSITHQNVDLKHLNIKPNDITFCYKQGLSYVNCDYVFCVNITNKIPSNTIKLGLKSLSTNCDAILFNHHGLKIPAYLDTNDLWNMRKEKTCALWRYDTLRHTMDKYYSTPMSYIPIYAIHLGYNIKSTIYDDFENSAPTGSFNDPFYHKSIRNTLEMFYNPEKISKIIYKTGPLEYNALSKNIKDLFQSTLKNNPELSIDYFDNTRCIWFLRRYFPGSILDTYLKIKPGAYRADLFRFCVIYIQGGIYSDLSQKFHIPIKDIVDYENDSLVLVEDIVLPPHTLPGIQINFMASRPRNPLFLSAIQRIVENVSRNFYGSTSLDPTGPYMFSKIYHTSNIPARMDLVQIHRETGSYVVFKNNTKLIVYDNKSTGHDENIKKTYENSYDTLWKQRNIYQPISSDDHQDHQDHQGTQNI